MASLADIRARLQAQDNKSSGSSFSGDNAIYPFWNIPEQSTAVMRFLPDGDDKNTFFWAERLMIRLPFTGVKGDTDSKNCFVQVPCMEMWGETCPILTEVRTWFKDASLEDMGRKYWKKRSYVFQGFVLDSPLAEDTVPENPIRRFIIGPQIFQILKSALMDPELEELPTDYMQGLDFRLTKTTKGGYSDYSTSSWSRRERALDKEEMNAITENGLWNLGDFLPKKPEETSVNVIKDMFEASVDGNQYDPDLYGQYFRPSGFAKPDAGTTSSAAPVASTAATEEKEAKQEESVSEAPKSSGGSKAEDILATIRSRQNQ